jgi:hypothetical protein
MPKVALVNAADMSGAAKTAGTKIKGRAEHLNILAAQTSRMLEGAASQSVMCPQATACEARKLPIWRAEHEKRESQPFHESQDCRVKIR